MITQCIELVSFENRRKNEIRLRESGSSSFRRDGKKSDDDEYFRAGLHRPEYDSNDDQGIDEDDDSDDSSYRPNESDDCDDDDDDEDEEEEESFGAAKKLFTKRTIKSRARATAIGVNDKPKKRNKDVKKKRKIPSSSSSTRSRNSMVPAALTRRSIRGSRSPLRKNKDKLDNDEENDSNKNELFHIEVESKLSTCMLRIRGLLNTIKSLEGKLATSNAEIEDKTAQLKGLQKKIHAIECKEKVVQQLTEMVPL